MGTQVVNPAAESATAEPNFDLSTFSTEQYSEWEKTGKVPDAKPAESSPAKTTESQAGASSDDEPAAESAPASQEQPPKGKKGADARIQELLRDRAELRARLEALEKPAVKTESAPVKPEAKLDRPARPVFGEAGHEAESWAEFEARQDAHVEAIADWKLAEADRKREEKAAADKQAEAAAEIDSTFKERIGKAQEKHADYADVAFSAEVPITPPMDRFIRKQPSGPEVLYYLGQHVEEAQSIAQMDQDDAYFTLSKIALSLAEPETPAPPPKKDAPVVPITKAAKPATDIRATSAAPVDELEAAMKAGDFARYEELANRRDVERRKRG